MRKSKVLIILLAVLVAAGTSIYFIQKAPAAEYFFVVDSTKAEIIEDSANKDKFVLKMIVREGHKATWFTDRPYRDAGQLTFSSLVGMWQTNEKNSFKADPPNVSISFNNKIVIATMRKPSIYRDSSGELVMQSTMTLVDETKLAKMKGEGKFLSKHASRVKTNVHGGSQMISDISLFIDGHGSRPTDGSASAGGLDKSDCMPDSHPSPGSKC
jgi:hypothetical protein